MSRRALLLFVALAIAAVGLPFPAVAQAPSQRGKGLDYDLDRVRQAQARAAQEVGQPPASLARALSDQPAHLFHPQQDELDLPKMLHANVNDLPALQEQMRAYLATRYRTQAAAADAAGEPLVFKVPVLMFRVHGDQWQEDSTPEKFEKMLSGIDTSPTGTVTEMYLEQSFGKMVVDFDVINKYDSVISNLPGNQCHYGTEGAPVTGDVLGLGGGGARGMAAEAVPQSDPDVDYGDYDNDLDGVVDFLLILHSGPDAAGTGNPCHVWSHYFGPIVSEPVQDPTMATSDVNAEGEPVVVGPVMTVPEVDLQIGVTAHELMHALGEPDYYGTEGTVGTGDWDLGAGGSWSGIPAQTNPVHFNPVMKINFGWVDPVRIDDTALDQALRPRANHPDLLQVPLRIAPPNSEAAAMCDKAPVGVPNQNNAFYTDDGSCLVEGFLIENVHQASAAFAGCAVNSADFDRNLYGSGLMIWHWDFTNYESLGNNNIMRPMLDIEEFDRRDDTQDTALGITRAEPLDVFWGDAVGISGATQMPPDGGGAAPPEGSPWTVTGPPTLGAAPATPTPEWEAAAVPDGTGMVVTLTPEQPVDDWDLYVDQWVDGQWTEVKASENGIPRDNEQVTITDFEAGDRFRARAVNYASANPTAELSVHYDGSAGTQLATAGTRNMDLEQTGWAFTNIRPADYRGLASASAQPRTPITLDLVRHDDSTVDVSGDFVRQAGDRRSPLLAGEPVDLLTRIYNHGGKEATATVSVYDADPATGADPIFSDTRTLDGFSRDDVEFTATLDEGLNELFVVATADGDVTPGNDVTRSELTAWGGDGRVLVVDDDFGWTREQAYVATLNSLDVAFDIVEGAPEAATLAGYDAVIWITTSVSGADGVVSADVQDTIATYLDDHDGQLWFDTTRAAGYADPAWLAGYFGFSPDQNLMNSMGTITGTGDTIGGQREIDVNYLDGRPYWDYGAIADDVKGDATSLFSHNEKPDAVFVTKVEGDQGFRTVYGLPLGLVEDGGERLQLTEEILGFLGVEPGGAAATDLTVAFERPQLVQVGQDWPLSVGAEAPGGVDAVELVHRPYGARQWHTLSLAEVGDGLFAGAIPGGQIGNNGLEYYVRVTTGGDVIDVDGGAELPNIASAPYGDPLQDRGCTAANVAARNDVADARTDRSDGADDADDSSDRARDDSQPRDRDHDDRDEAHDEPRRDTSPSRSTSFRPTVSPASTSAPAAARAGAGGGIAATGAPWAALVALALQLLVGGTALLQLRRKP